LRDLAFAVEASASPASITFAHAETASGRTLVLERRGGQVAATGALAAAAVLFAPVADEIPTSSLVVGRGAIRGAILQGWRRSTGGGEPVRPQSIAAMDSGLIAALGALDLVIGSSEDLQADGADPLPPLQAL